MLKSTKNVRCAVGLLWVVCTACSDDSGSNKDAGDAAESGADPASADDAGAGADPVRHVDRSGLSDVGTDEPLDYARNELWMCRPDNDPDACHGDLDATELEPDGTRAVVPHEAAEHPDFDCFYVYPTVLLTGAAQMTDFTDRGVEPVYDPLLTQAARFSRVCTLYAPLYRQTGLSGGMPVAGADDALALQDVRDAFAYYLEHLNRGRKFVLIGHSQGTFMLTALMQMDVDGDAALRARMISAVLIGGRVYVPQGARVGDTFKNIPICSEPGETGCVIAYVSYAKQAPPSKSSLFGGAMGDSEAACVNPSLLAGNAGAYRGSYFPVATANPSFAADVPAPSDVQTPFVLYREMFSGECVTRNGFHYLEYTLLAGADDPRGTPPWRHSTVDALGFGTHLVDFHVPLDDLIDAVAMQAAAAR